jgi:hypothetical protein
MGKNAIALIVGLLVGLGACAPALEGNGQAGGTIHSLQLWPGAAAETTGMAEGYCGRFNRSAHIAREELGWVWTDTIAFECI